MLPPSSFCDQADEELDTFFQKLYYPVEYVKSFPETTHGKRNYINTSKAPGSWELSHFP